MSDIFVSYSRRDRAWVERLIAALEAEGWTVWWDREIGAGRDFRKVIETELMRARCVVVVWSPHSIESGWVRDEANLGMDRGILIPITIDGVLPPLGFRSLHTEMLGDWEGSSSQNLDKVLRDIRGVLEGPGVAHQPPKATSRHVTKAGASTPRWMLAFAALVATFLVGVWATGWMSRDTSGGDSGNSDSKWLEILRDRESSVELKSTALVELLKSGGTKPADVFTMGYLAEEQHGQGLLRQLMYEYAENWEPMNLPLGSVDLPGKRVGDFYEIPGWALDDVEITEIGVKLNGIDFEETPSNCPQGTRPLPTACYGFIRTDIETLYKRYSSETLRSGFLIYLPAADLEGRKVKLTVRLVDNDSRHLPILSAEVCFSEKGAAFSSDDPSCG